MCDCARAGYTVHKFALLIIVSHVCRPDILVLGKALSGGVMPVSAVLADDQVPATIYTLFGSAVR
jgi:adenosylmethionine-8-amino-7-oxononanoate aminotransferase